MRDSTASSRACTTARPGAGGRGGAEGPACGAAGLMRSAISTLEDGEIAVGQGQDDRRDGRAEGRPRAGAAGQAAVRELAADDLVADLRVVAGPGLAADLVQGL